MLVLKSREVAAGPDRVWSTLVDWDNETKYWTNVRNVKILRSEANSIEREATVGPRGFAQKTRQSISLEPGKSIKLTLAGDQISGERTILLVPRGTGKTKVSVAWSLELENLPGFVQGIVKNQISKITDEALEKIAKSSEHAEARMETG